MSFNIIRKRLKLLETGFALFIRKKQNDNEKNDGSTGVNVLYLQSPNYKNIKDSNSFENFV